MGMSSDQNENVSFAEQVAAKKREAERLAKEQNIPSYVPMGLIKIKNKEWQLLVGEDKKWYKAKWIREERYDEMNRTPLVDVFGEVIPLTKEEFESYFKSEKPVKRGKKS